MDTISSLDKSNDSKTIKSYCSTTIESFMKGALKEAEKAAKKNEAPIGAVIVMDGKIIARGHNERETKQDVTKHAEITAIKKACARLGSWRLCDCDLYVTLEPCPMCAGAIIQARIKRLYFGASDPKAGAAGSLTDLFNVEGQNHKVEVTSGILTEACSTVLKDFFRRLRQSK